MQVIMYKDMAIEFETEELFNGYIDKAVDDISDGAPDHVATIIQFETGDVIDDKEAYKLVYNLALEI